MRNGLKVITLGIMSLALSGCLDVEDLVEAEIASRNDTQFSQTIGITTKNGSGELIQQSFTSGGVAAGISRVCLTNRTGGNRALGHQVSGINPLATPPGGRSCANFSSAQRVTFLPYTNSDPATPAKTLVYGMSAFDGGTLDLVWSN